MTDEADRVAKAGNYVLGLMDDAEREQAERDMEIDGAFRDAVLQAAVTYHKLDLTAVPETVPADLWNRISERIAELPQMRAMPKTDGAARPAVITAASPPKRVGPHAFGGWRGAALAASLLAACAVGYVAGVSTTGTPAPIVVVVLDTPADTPGAIFEAYADDSVRIVPLEDFVVPEGKTMQVWTLYDPAVGPVSLGTIGRQATEVRITGPHLPLPKADQLYEITVEPAPGSPTGKPTGPILVKGFARQPAGA